MSSTILRKLVIFNQKHENHEIRAYMIVRFAPILHLYYNTLISLSPCHSPAKS